MTRHLDRVSCRETTPNDNCQGICGECSKLGHINARKADMLIGEDNQGEEVNFNWWSYSSIST